MHIRFQCVCSPCSISAEFSFDEIQCFFMFICVNTWNLLAERQPYNSATCISVENPNEHSIFFQIVITWFSVSRSVESTSFGETQPYCTWKVQQAQKYNNSPAVLIDLVFLQGATLFHTSYLLLKWLSLWKSNLLTFQTAGWGTTGQLSVCFDCTSLPAISRLTYHTEPH